MHFTSLLALTTSLSLAAAAPTTQAARAVGTWTLRNYVRICDDAKNACTYSFTVADNNSGRTDDCNFTDQADASRSARWSSPSNLACSPGSPIYVNIGYDAPGNFFVVVPVNTETNLNAFFGYTAAEMADGNVVTPDHTSDSLVIGTWELAKANGGAAVKARDAADLGQWTVEKLHRTCQTDTTATCSYNFQINQNDGSALANCDLVIEGPPTQSFYTKPCQNMPQWLISWGYNAEFGYAVMTVVSQPKQVDAFFGFNDINTNVDFPNVGPNPVYHL